MNTETMERIERDGLATSVGKAMAIANEAAQAQGTDPHKALVTIMQHSSDSERTWHVHYGTRDYAHQRGGDLTVIVDEVHGTVRQILYGQ